VLQLQVQQTLAPPCLQILPHRLVKPGRKLMMWYTVPVPKSGPTLTSASNGDTG
jgi:hypothetical protein